VPGAGRRNAVEYDEERGVAATGVTGGVNMKVIVELVIILVLVLANAVFAMAEIAVVSARTARLSTAAKKVIERPRRYWPLRRPQFASCRPCRSVSP